MNYSRGFLFIILIIFGVSVVLYGQGTVDENYFSRQQLISEYNYLDTSAMKLDNQLEKSLAKIEIADGLWWLDITKAKRILKNAFELTISIDKSKNEEKRGKEISKGVFLPSSAELDSQRLRSRIFEIALRDKQFSKQLINIAQEELGKDKGATAFTLSANIALKSGDVDSAEQYITFAINSGEFSSSIGYAIYALAEKNRHRADNLILRYFATVSSRPITTKTLQSIIFGLDAAVFADNVFDVQSRKVEPASNEVIKEYLNFALNKISEIGQSQSGGLQQMRGTIVSLWRRVSVYAPELVSRFLILEKESRLNPNDDNLPETITPEKQKELDDSVLEEAKKTEDPKAVERAIEIVLKLNNFKEARELASLFKDEKVEKYFMNKIDWKESLYLIDEKEFYEAEKIARRMDSPNQVLYVYSSLISKLFEKGDKEYAKNLTYEAVRKLKGFDENASLSYQIGKLTQVAAKIDSDLAFDLLAELVASLNNEDVNFESIEPRFNSEVFIELAKIDELRSKGIAESLSNKLQKIVALASIYKWKTKKVLKDIEKSELESKRPVTLNK